MGLSKTDTWKSKIDPAFDKLIRTYVQFLSLCHLTAGDGYLRPDEHALKLLERKKYPALDEQYDLDFRMVSKAIPDLIKLGMSKSISVTAKAAWKDIKEIEKYVSNMVKQLPDGESKDYYTTRFLLNKSKEEAKVLVKSLPTEKLNQMRKSMLTDISTLIYHIWFMLGSATSSVNPVVNDLGLLKVMLSNTFNTLSLLVHKKPMKKLLEEARKGNDESLLKAIQIDRTLFNAEFVRTRINKAQYTGDHSFFEGLASSLIKTPLQNDVEYIELSLALSFFWKMGLYRLTNKERRELLKSSGVIVQDDPENFRKYVTRLKDEGFLSD